MLRYNIFAFQGHLGFYSTALIRNVVLKKIGFFLLLLEHSRAKMNFEGKIGKILNRAWESKKLKSVKLKKARVSKKSKKIQSLL